MLRFVAFALTLSLAAPALADASAPTGVKPEAGGKGGIGDWCWRFFTAERDRAKQGKLALAPRATVTDAWAPVTPFPGGPLALRVPPGYSFAVAKDRVWYLAKRHVEDPLRELASGWEPILVAHRDPKRGFDAILESMKDSGDLFPATVTHATRETKHAGHDAVELCAVVARSPGHATLVDGRHVPMPLTYDLVHGYRIQMGDESVSLIARVEQGRSFDEEPILSQVLAQASPAVAAPRPRP